MSKFIPNSFQVPNALVDEALEKISGNAAKAYLLIVRKTRGWQKETDAISLSQFEKIGMSRKTILAAIDELVSVGLVSKTSGSKGVNVFSLNDSDWCKNSTGGEIPLVEKLHHTGGETPPVTGGETPHTKDTIKNTIQKTGGEAAQAEPKQQAKPAKKATRATSLPDDFAISEQVRQWAAKQGFAPWLDLHLEHFRDYALSKGKTYTDWDAAFRNAIRDDWGDVRKRNPSPAPAPVTAQKPRTDIVSPERRAERVAMLRAAMIGRGVH